MLPYTRRQMTAKLYTDIDYESFPIADLDLDLHWIQLPNSVLAARRQAKRLALEQERAKIGRKVWKGRDKWWLGAKVGVSTTLRQSEEEFSEISPVGAGWCQPSWCQNSAPGQTGIWWGLKEPCCLKGRARSGPPFNARRRGIPHSQSAQHPLRDVSRSAGFGP